MINELMFDTELTRNQEFKNVNKVPKAYDYCVYTSGESDYWGSFDTQKELFAFLNENFPGFSYDPKKSNEYRAFYNCGEILIIVNEVY